MKYPEDPALMEHFKDAYDALYNPPERKWPGNWLSKAYDEWLEAGKPKIRSGDIGSRGAEISKE